MVVSYLTDNNIPPTMDIALFKCGDFAEKVHEQIGDDYSKVFKDWLQASLSNPLVNKFTLDSYDVVQDIYPNEDLYDCIMLTGSRTVSLYCSFIWAHFFFTLIPTLTAATAYEDIYWINKLTRYIAHVVENKPRIKIVGALPCIP